MEWIELVELGWNRVVEDSDPSEIERAILGAIGAACAIASPYGYGNAAERISHVLFSTGKHI